MTATFGALDGAVLTPGEGLTVVTAPNETGKSTWAGFLKAMLYGIDTRERDRSGFLADKTRYLPWSGFNYFFVHFLILSFCFDFWQWRSTVDFYDYYTFVY